MNVITISNVESVLGASKTWDTLYNENSLTLRRSAYSLDFSEITIKIMDGLQVNSGDYIKFFAYDFEILGKVNSAENQENYINIKFSWGLDFHQRHIFLPENSTTLVNFMVNIEEVVLILNDTFNVISTDNTLYSDQIFRQAYRKKHYIEYLLNIDNPTIGATPSNRDEYNIRLDDPSINESTQVVEFSDDTVNELTLYNKDNLTQFQTYYLEDDGTVVTTGQNVYKVRKNLIQLVEADEWSVLQFAKDILLKQEYSNSIEITTDYPLMNDIKINELLGLKCVVWYNENPVRTFISEYELQNNILNIKFGLSNSNLTRILKGD